MKKQHILRFEKTATESKWDSKARRSLSELAVFFPEWGKLVGTSDADSKIRAYSAEVFWVKPAGDLDVAGRKAFAKTVSAEILGSPLSHVSFEESRFEEPREGFQWWCLEKAFRAGVTDNAGHILAEAVRLVTGSDGAECRSGSRLWLELPAKVPGKDVARYADQVFYNGLIERVDVWKLEEALENDKELFSKPNWVEISSENGDALQVESFDIRKITIDELVKLSNERLWALSKAELEAIQAHYRELGRDMSDVEIEVIAQTWSEHCKHKIFAANIEVQNDRDDIELPARVESVFKTYIRGATQEIPAPYLKSVFEDNAGVINVTSELDVAIKVETHNSPSALDPYGGALTGIVGVNRDILGVGLGAQPIANLDVFCVGPTELEDEKALPPRLHHPRRILEGVRIGVEHGGNKSGIPTVTGAVVEHPGYLGKPLVFCGTLGVIPANTQQDLISKSILPGDKIVMAGGRIGKDGIHGATFSSLEMNEDSPVSAVQLGDPLTQRRVWDFLIEARDLALFRAVTDNGAGGLSSSIGELARLCGKRGGAAMDVGLAATKYEGLKPFELTVSESQERMSFAVDPKKLEVFLELAARRGVECSVLGEFQDSGHFRVLYRDKVVGDLEMKFLHDGAPKLELKARVKKPVSEKALRYGVWQGLLNKCGVELSTLPLQNALPHILQLPNVRSQKKLAQQYDHEVQARSVRKPYGTPDHGAPNDGACLRISRTTHEGVAVGLGLAPFAAEIDAKVAAELAFDEALRNAIVAGMDPTHAALIDNFCWPDPLPGPNNPVPGDAEAKLGALVVTCKRIFEGAVEMRMPFISGKDSMKNDYRMDGFRISVPPTLLITAMGKVHDVRKVPRGYAMNSDDETRRVLWVSGQDVVPNPIGLPNVNFERAYRFFYAFHELVRQGGVIESAHDVSDGGWLTTTAEMLFGTGAGARLDLELGDHRKNEPEWAPLFGEPATSFVILARESVVESLKTAFQDFTVLDVGQIVPATLETAELSIKASATLRATWSVSDLRRAYSAGGAQ